MKGDERVRFCPQCRLNVYNISAMPAREAEQLLIKREGRLCVRLYRRPDGTILTQDCPVGFRARVKRISLVAGAALSALLRVSPAAVAQTPSSPIRESRTTVRSDQTHDAYGEIVLIVMDRIGAVIPNAHVSVFDEKRTTIFQGETDGRGRFEVKELTPGYYSLQVKAFGFRLTEVSKIQVRPGLSETTQVAMEIGEAVMGGSIVGWNPIVETDSAHMDDLLPLLPAPTTPAANKSSCIKRLFKAIRDR